MTKNLINNFVFLGKRKLNQDHQNQVLSSRTDHSSRIKPRNISNITVYMYDREVREALEISKLRTLNEKDRTFKVLNRGSGDCVSAKTWKPLSMKMLNR